MHDHLGLYLLAWCNYLYNSLSFWVGPNLDEKLYLQISYIYVSILFKQYIFSSWNLKVQTFWAVPIFAIVLKKLYLSVRSFDISKLLH